jgi:hypothetical protein
MFIKEKSITFVTVIVSLLLPDYIAEERSL